MRNRLLIMFSNAANAYFKIASSRIETAPAFLKFYQVKNVQFIVTQTQIQPLILLLDTLGGRNGK